MDHHPSVLNHPQSHLQQYLQLRIQLQTYDSPTHCPPNPKNIGTNGSFLSESFYGPATPIPVLKCLRLFKSITMP